MVQTVSQRNLIYYIPNSFPLQLQRSPEQQPNYFRLSCGCAICDNYVKLINKVRFNTLIPICKPLRRSNINKVVVVVVDVVVGGHPS